MKIVYISGPVVGNATQTNIKATVEKNINEAKKYAETLANTGIGFCCPHVHNVELKNKSVTDIQRYYYDLDSEFLIRVADALIAIPGWETSNGAKYEIEIAKTLQLPIFYPKSPDDLNEVINWFNESKSDTVTDRKVRETREETIDWNKVIELKRALSKYRFMSNAA